MCLSECVHLCVFVCVCVFLYQLDLIEGAKYLFCLCVGSGDCFFRYIYQKWGPLKQTLKVINRSHGWGGF